MESESVVFMRLSVYQLPGKVYFRPRQVKPGLVNSPPQCILSLMNMTFTAVFRRFPEGYAAFVEELPGANTQGATLEEARANLLEAARMVMEANRQLAEEELRGQEVIREPLLLGAS